MGYKGQALMLRDGKSWEKIDLSTTENFLFKIRMGEDLGIIVGA